MSAAPPDESATLAARAADFVMATRLADCPDAALAQARCAVLDTIACMLLGASHPAARIVRGLARVEAGPPDCTVVGSSLRTTSAWAALANGVAGHAEELDDTSFALMGHPSVPLLATALACGEVRRSDGADVLLAYLLGFEVNVAFGVAVNPEHYERGWHATATIGALGCAATAARLLALDRTQIGHALGIAASLASGIKENFGSMMKAYQTGNAASNGVRAAQLAKAGMTASATALDGSQGWAVASSGVRLSPDALDLLGRRWEIVTSGRAVKRHASCALTHPAIDALLDLRSRHGLVDAAIAEIEIGVDHITFNTLTHAAPRTASERKFSMPFCAATALASGRLTVAAFDDGLTLPPVARLMPRVRMLVGPSEVKVTLTDGTVLVMDASRARGHPDQPLDTVELREKFRSCAAGALTPYEVETVIELVDRLVELPDIRALSSRLSGRARDDGAGRTPR